LALDLWGKVDIIGTRSWKWKRAESGKKSDRNWYKKGLDKKIGLNIIDKPVSKRSFAGDGKR
jgi:hypothetical protein